MTGFIKINCAYIKEGMRFSAPVFFDDGKNMFLAEGKSVKAYHVAALKRWSIPYLLTYGHELKGGTLSIQTYDDGDQLEDLEIVEDAKPGDNSAGR